MTNRSRVSQAFKLFAIMALLLTVVPCALAGCGSSSASSSSGGESSSDASASASSESASSEAGSSGASSAAASSSSAPAVQRIGSAAKTGTLEVPGGWIDTSRFLDAAKVKEYDVVQYADNTTAYTSKALKGDAYSSSIRIQQYPAAYSAVAEQIVKTYEESPLYSSISSESKTFNGHKATVVNSKLTDDNLMLTDIAIDKNNDGKACVLITVQAMPNDFEKVLDYAESWSIS